MSTVNDRCIQYPYQSEPDTSEDRELWYVSVPAVDYIREAFFGALSTLGFPDSYNPISDTAAEYGSEIVASLTQIIPPEEVTVPGQMSRADLWFRFATPGIVSSAISPTFNSNQLFGHYSQLAAPAVNNLWEFPLTLQPGTYTGRLVFVRQLNSGILTMSQVDPSDVAAQIGSNIDFHASFALNQENIFSFVVPAQGTKAIRLSCGSKNAGSTGYQLAITGLFVWRTGS